MQWITALLAFATTMLIFAMIVSVLVETIHRIFKRRSAGMELMLVNFYEEAVAPLLQTKSDKDQRAKDAREFAGIIMRNRATESATDGANWLVRLFGWMLDASRVTDIPTEVFTQKLAGYAAVKNISDKVEAGIADLSQKYVAIGAEMTLYFESRARLIAVLVAIVVAYAFNVDPYAIMRAYVANPEAAARVAATSDDAHDRFTALEKRLSQEADKATGDDAEALKAEIAELKKAFADGEKAAGELGVTGVPVGWPAAQGLAPCFGSAPAPSAAATAPASATGTDLGLAPAACRLDVPWIGVVPAPVHPSKHLLLLIGGLLIGLGAPFWAQTVASLTLARDVSRQIADIVSPQGGGRAGPTAQAAGEDRPPAAVKAFEVARGKAAPRTEEKLAKPDGKQPPPSGPRSPTLPAD